VATGGTLIAAGKPGRNGGLVGIGDALTVGDSSSDAGSGVGAEAMFEGVSPLGVAALLHPVVHGAMLYLRSVLPAGLEFEEKLLTERSGCSAGGSGNASMLLLRSPLIHGWILG
jgi:hypothetical protein